MRRGPGLRKHVRCIAGRSSASRSLASCLSPSLSFFSSEVCPSSKLSFGKRSAIAEKFGAVGGRRRVFPPFDLYREERKERRQARGAYVAFVFHEASGHETTIDAPSSVEVCKVRESTKRRERDDTGNNRTVLNVAVEARVSFNSGQVQAPRSEIVSLHVASSRNRKHRGPVRFISVDF